MTGITNSKPSERREALAILPPASDTSARSTPWVSLGKHHSALVTVSIGANTATAAISLLRATDTSGAGTVAIATVQVGGAGTVGNDQVYLFNVDPAADLTATHPYLGVEVGASGAYFSAAVIEGYDQRYSGDDLPAVTVVR